MIKITFPDNSVREYESGVTPLQVAESISSRLAQDILCASIKQPSAVSDQNSDIEDFIPNPFNAQELESDPTIPHGKGIHYLVDVSGKLLGIYEGEVPMSHLPIGVYFIKSFYDGTWHTRKILVQ